MQQSLHLRAELPVDHADELRLARIGCCHYVRRCHRAHKILSGHIESVLKQFNLAKKLAGIADSIVLYCARHRFGTDAMEGTGNLMAVMDVTGHSKLDVTRIYQHPGLRQVTEAIEKRNQ